jgi:hypothetical protein
MKEFYTKDKTYHYKISHKSHKLHFDYGARRGAVVETLRYKLEGRGIDSRWCLWNFSFTYSFRPHYGSRIDSVSNRNEYQEYSLGVKEAGA